MMKILFLARSLEVGGAERQLVELAKGLKDRGHIVSVAVFYAGGSLEKELLESNIPIHDLKKSGRWEVVSFLGRLASFIRTYRPDISYGFLGVPNILLTLIRPFARTKVVWGVRASNMDLSKYDWLARVSYKVECALSPFPELIICNSYAGRSYALANGFPDGKTTVIPNGIDTNRFKIDRSLGLLLRNEWGVTEQHVLIGLVGRIDPMKDIATFLHAAAKVSSSRKNIKFVIVGDGLDSYKKTLSKLCFDLELKNLIWGGQRSDMPAVYNALDVLVSSSITEGFSNVIAEAMSSGVPCVVTDVGDSSEIVKGAGEVVPPSSPDAMANALHRVLERSGDDLKINTRKNIEQRFSKNVMITNTAKILEELL